MHKTRKRRTWGSLFFLIIVIAIYGVTFLFDDHLAANAFKLAEKLLYQLIPVLVFVFALIFLSNLIIEPDWVRRNLGKESGLKGWVVAVIAGILSAGPVYPWYALLSDLKDKGMRSALITVFLYNRGIKLPLLPIMIHYFGLVFTLILATYLTLFSVLSGLLMEVVIDKDMSQSR